MAKKFTEVERGTFQKVGKEYDYVLEVGDDFNGKKDMRVRIIEERPVIEKVRTRYDPEIQLFGSKNASMNVSLGYNMKEINSTIKWLKHAFLLPIYVSGFIVFYFFVAYYIFKMPSDFIPKWTLFILVPLILVLSYYIIKKYSKFILTSMAEYFKAKDLKRLLLKEGYRK